MSVSELAGIGKLPAAEARVDFQHEIHILSPVVDRGQTLWFGYIDEVGSWHRGADTPGTLLASAGSILEKLLRWERGERVNNAFGNRSPNVSSGGARDVPNVPPRWTVRVTADCSDKNSGPEWTITTLDESAWGGSDVQLSELLRRLAARIEAAKISPTPLLSTLPTAVTRIGEPSDKVESGPRTFEEMTEAVIGRVTAEIAKKKQRAWEVQQEVEKLEVEQRALKAALRAYKTPPKRLGRKKELLQ
jgi:hypothetical protein